MEGLWLTPADAFDLLLSLPAPDELPPTLRLGVDCRFWVLAARLVQETLAQQKVLPALERKPTKSGLVAFVAQWQPVLDHPRDRPRLAKLQAVMPSLCRADADTPDKAPGAAQLLDSFVHTVTDALFRRWAASSTPYFFPQDTGLEYTWIRALFAAEDGGALGLIKGAAQPLARLATSHHTWLRNLTVAGDQHYRVGFRLEAPQQQAAARDWRLHFLFQGQEDPSLLVPAEEIWKRQSAVLKALADPPEQPQEKLLAGLGYAARLYPPLARSLQQSTPSVTELDTEEAFNFLRETAPLLEQSGFAIFTPPWWNQPGSRLGIRLRLGSQPKLSTEHRRQEQPHAGEPGPLSMGSGFGRHPADERGVSGAGGAEVAVGADPRAMGAAGHGTDRRRPEVLAADRCRGRSHPGRGHAAGLGRRTRSRAARSSRWRRKGNLRPGWNS